MIRAYGEFLKAFEQLGTEWIALEEPALVRNLSKADRDLLTNLYKKLLISKGKIRECIQWQEEIGLDVLVHGEYERNDMVEYFGE